MKEIIIGWGIILLLIGLGYTSIQYDFWKEALWLVGGIFICIMMYLTILFIKKLTKEEAIYQTQRRKE